MSNVHRNLLTACNNVSWLLKNSLKFNSTILRMASSQTTDQMVVPKEDVVRFITECLTKSGTTPEDGRTVAHHLMTADYSGHFSHGLNRMQMYVEDIKGKMTDPVAKAKIITDFQAVALVDGNNGLGQVIGKFCMELAMEKAKKFGIGMVTARGSNHYGICGYYTSMAIEQCLIGFTCTNTSPLMAPTRSKCAGLGTNPLSLGMGATGGDRFVLDMATTAVALGKIELAIRKNEPIPTGWALGTDGKPTTDSEDAYKASLLMPLGGEEKNSGYKGYGLGLMVEVLCGILSGSEFGPNIRQWKNKGKIANLGQCFMAINPAAFGCGSEERLAKLLQQLRNLPTAGDEPVLIAGDKEREAMACVDIQGGITYHPNQLKASKEFAESMGVQPMKLIPKKAV
ncbi:Malate dehydrogenase [Anthophora quadrimaculata]